MSANGGTGPPLRGAPFVTATVVRAQSPTSVRAGDSAIVRPHGAIEGFVGGTCAEASVRLHSLRAMETGTRHAVASPPEGRTRRSLVPCTIRVGAVIRRSSAVRSPEAMIAPSWRPVAARSWSRS